MNSVSRQNLYLGLFCIFSILYLVFVFLVYKFGPDDLFLDAFKILDRDDYVRAQGLSLGLFDSYTLTSYIYHFLVFGNDLRAIDFMGFIDYGDINLTSFIVAGQVLLLLVSAFVMFLHLYPVIGRLAPVMLFICFFCTAFYFTVPSKDIFLYFGIFISVFVSRIFRYFIYVYSIFRPFVLGTMLGYIILRNLSSSLFLKVLFPIVFFVLFFFEFPEVLGKPSAAYTAGTGIVNYFENTSYGIFLVNGVIDTVRLLFPVEFLFVDFGKTILVFFKLSFTFLIGFLLKYCQIKSLNILILSFVFFQGCFEPDLGSSLRHMAVLIPLFAYMVLNSYEKRDCGRLA